VAYSQKNLAFISLLVYLFATIIYDTESLSATPNFGADGMRLKMFFIVCVTTVAAMLSSSGPLAAQIGSTSAGTDRFGSFFAFSAKTMDFPSFYVFQNTHFFKGTGERSGGTSSVKDFGVQLGLQMGLTKTLDLIVNGNFVQTANRDPNIPSNKIVSLFKSVDVPQSFYMNFRLVPYSFAQNKINMGFMLTTKFSSNNFANMPFQTYSSGHTEAGLSLLASYFAKPEYPESAFALHANVQYWNHLDNGAYVGFYSLDSVRKANNSIADTSISKHNTSSLRLAIGMSYPIEVGGRFLYITADFYTQMFLVKPPEGAYSRQNFGYAAIGAKYQWTDWLAVHIGGEFLVMKQSTPATVSSPLTGISDLTVSKADYPSWRIFTGVSFPLMPRAQSLSSKQGHQVVQEQESFRKKEVSNILYSEQEIQKRSVNFVPLKEMRKSYKSIIGELVTILEAKDKKVEEPSDIVQPTEIKKSEEKKP
jgi:hypothetical protein